MITFETDAESDAALAELMETGESRDVVIKEALLWALKWQRSERRWEENIRKAREDAVSEGRDPEGAADEVQCMREMADVFAW